VNARLRAVAAAVNGARRRAGLDRNPMRRREDRIQSAVGPILVVAFLLLAPWAAISVGRLVYGSELRTEHIESAQRHTVTASVIDSGKTAVHSTVRTLKVSWRDGKGTLRTADYQATAREVGTTTTIWVDRADRAVLPPRPHTQTVADTVMTGIGVTLAILAALASAYALLRRRLDRSRYRLWDADWEWADINWGQRGNRPERG
jgi:limonene-1,2-epoxide hydrolase